MNNEKKEDILLPDPEASEVREKKQLEEWEGEKDWSLFEVQQSIRKAVNNGYFSYRDLADILKNIYDEDEREALKRMI